MSKALFATLLLMLAIHLAGCVGMSRNDVTISTAPTDNMASGAEKARVYVTAITDDRDFSKDTSDNAQPTLDDDIANMSKGEIATIIGRQSNAYGVKLANITLQKGANVQSVMKTLVEQGLKRAGYYPSNDPKSPIKATVSVTDFWGWLNSGWAFNYKARVAAKVTLSMPGGKRSILSAMGYGENVGYVLKAENFRQAFEPALAEFKNNLTNEAEKLPSGLGPPSLQAHDNVFYGDLKQLGELHNSGVLTDDEFQSLKRKLIAKQNN